ncbi:MAG: glycosyltransferase family 2 protein [Syntrophales bacterium]|nr:glycosyltransferase family 2 protein [Syntrophales bacterium]
MNISKNIGKYLKNYAVADRWRLVSKRRCRVDNIVVIPALAEKESLFRTLASLSENEQSELNRTLIICVMNNRRGHITSLEDIGNNQETIRLLKNLMESDNPVNNLSNPLIDKICRSNLKISYIDASSPGSELPDKNGGVGLARKIGLDIALKVFDYKEPCAKLLFCLDADTVVERDYLSAVRRFFEKEKATAAVVAFQHQDADDPSVRAAICCYEIFLRYYVLGLSYANSMYAFHSIGSTIACTADAYVAVRGMNRREAAEDFYFLNKLAKIGSVGLVNTTRVYPSARPSNRVPFGTGQRVIRFLEGGQDEYILYDPKVFSILREWLQLMPSCLDKDAGEILILAEKIHPLLESFLMVNNFSVIWHRLRENSKSSDGLYRQFLSWFDGFKTLRLIHHLTENGISRIEMFTALTELLEMMGRSCPERTALDRTPDLGVQLKILGYLRKMQIKSGETPDLPCR